MKNTAKATVDSLRMDTLTKMPIELPSFEEQIKMGDMTDLYVMDAETGTYIPLGDVTKPLPEKYRYKGDLVHDVHFETKDLDPSVIVSYDCIVR